MPTHTYRKARQLLEDGNKVVFGTHRKIVRLYTLGKNLPCTSCFIENLAGTEETYQQMFASLHMAQHGLYSSSLLPV